MDIVHVAHQALHAQKKRRPTEMGDSTAVCIKSVIYWILVTFDLHGQLSSIRSMSEKVIAVSVPRLSIPTSDHQAIIAGHSSSRSLSPM
ncbi:hypothetical protein [Nonomuraea sp. 10N515B]|uniref:hypothetical protein n=1 Tax=Nonomuraea sp. 10N515B TaxID=3457422 RepID=UPI003FCE293A